MVLLDLVPQTNEEWGLAAILIGAIGSAVGVVKQQMDRAHTQAAEDRAELRKMTGVALDHISLNKEIKEVLEEIAKGQQELLYYQRSRPPWGVWQDGPRDH